MNTNTSTEQAFWTSQRTAGALLVAAILPLALGLFLFNRKWAGAPDNATLFVWEKGFIVAAVVLTALGFTLLEATLHKTNGRVMARLGASAYFFGAVLLVAAEARRLSAGPLLIVYVVLALLGQAAIGRALLQSNLLPAWIGWTTIAWNLGLLIVLPIVTPGDIYYPIAHHLMPLLIGVPLLMKTNQENSQSRTARVGWGILIGASALLNLASIFWYRGVWAPMMGLLALLVALEGYRNGSRWAWTTMWVLVTIVWISMPVIFGITLLRQ